MKKLILASQSPRRCHLLQQFGLPFEVIAANIDETPHANETANAMVLRLAECKAETIFQQLANRSDHRVLGSDTAVVIGDRVLGKPADKQTAVAMLQQLSGTTHRVLSAVALIDTRGCQSLLSESKVTFKPLSLEIILHYCDGDDCYDKAGGYGIQGVAGQFVHCIEGSYSGIMGLPLWQTHQLLMH